MLYCIIFRKQINENKKNVNAYVVFENAESVSKALKM